jgi:hypothetical protein
VTQADERERDDWHRRAPMTKREKLDEIRRMRAKLQGEATKERNERE